MDSGNETIDLHMELQQARCRLQDVQSRRQQHRIYTARIKEDIKNLSKEGFRDTDIAQIFNIPLRTVKAFESQIKFETYDEAKRKFLATGEIELPCEPAGYIIFR